MDVFPQVASAQYGVSDTGGDELIEQISEKRPAPDLGQSFGSIRHHGLQTAS
jgi:hypothetical protein